jgi:membrane-bound lytic murein transglycosylase B
MNRLRALVPLLVLLSFPAWSQPFAEREEVRAFATEMAQRHGFSADRLLGLFRRVSPNAAILKAIAPPAEPGQRSWQIYRSRFVEPQRIAAGLRFWQRHAAALAKAHAVFGVPEEIIVAIIGVESLYGYHLGRFSAFEALATLAFDYPPRAHLFRRELEELLLLAREEKRSPLAYKGSYAGALGLPQFLPSSIRRLGTDFDGDGRIDLVNSPWDAIGSVANFLRENGWQEDGLIAAPVTVSGDPAPLIAEGIRPQRLPSEMVTFGVQADEAPRQPAALIDLETPDAPTEYRLGFGNFFVLTRYNRSSFYAAAVADLAAALKATRPAAPHPAAEDGATGPRPPTVSGAPAPE